ncbi:FecR protein [Posidoniimonas corsicana]|uniref:FecR protein n=1 Tax=Posidoniimonas corsicana TaxID=1938618 RepID=A0A5C5VBP5_9BACT|nr:FecR family protein [Posidoniimonas corsicana]TWT35978.1 FecR protein [Posidoniimonas corsicana]
MTDPREQSDLDRLEQLVGDKCNGALDSDGYAELHALLARSERLRCEYWELIAFNTDLHWVLADVRTPQQRRDTDSPTPHHGQPVRLPIYWLAAALAASLLAAIGLAVSLWPGSEDDLPTVVADAGGERDELALPNADSRASQQPAQQNPGASTAIFAASLTSPTNDSRWRSSQSSDANPQRIRLGEKLWVDAGAIEMQIDGGAVGVLRAPVELQLHSSSRLQLVRGRITVTAPKLTNGFTVDTPSAEVVDLGTVFSVAAAETGTDLVVFGGKVDLRVPPTNPKNGGAPPGDALHLAKGDAVHVSSEGGLSRIMSVQSSGDPMDLNRAPRTPVVGSVADNVDREGNWKFYEIVAGGMREDAPAYVDRFHEWNGLTPDGMPAYLVGGDYVRMFNEDKADEDLRIEIMLTRPSALYVLLDNRVAAPDWLAASFENTGDEIGVDESPHDTANRFPANDQFAQVGPGESIDRVHSIWKAAAPNGGPVVLGPNGLLPNRQDQDPRPRYIRANMYGVVAVPLADAPAAP